MSVYISAASLIISAMALAWSRHQWRVSAGSPKATLHYGMLAKDGVFLRLPWPHGQRGEADYLGLPVLMVTVKNTGRGALFVEYVEIYGTICGVCGPHNLEFPLTVEAHRDTNIYYLPVSMGFMLPEQMNGKRIRATVYYDVNKKIRSNPLLLGQHRKHAKRAKAIDLGPSLTPAVSRF